MKQEKLESILDMAKKLFARYGLQKTSMDELARMARVAKATIYNYFGTKDRVYMEVLRREADEVLKHISSSVAKEPSPKAKLFSFARAKFRYMRGAANLLNLERDGAQKVFPAAEEVLRHFFDREVDIIRSILKEGIEKGVFYLKDTLLAARTIAHALRGFELNWLIKESEDRMDHYLDELINMLFHGLMSENRISVKT